MNSKAFFAIFVLVSGLLNGQSLSVGASICASNYSGDLTLDNKAIISQTRNGYGLNLNYELDQYVSFRALYENLEVTANDAISKIDWQMSRNLNFTSKINSFDLGGMVNIRSLIFPNFEFINLHFSGGYTIFTFNPIAHYNGNNYELQNLGTEGQGMTGYQNKYKLWAGAINFGMVLEYRITNHLSVQSQILFRKTNTDYLDDISTSYIDYNLLSEQNGQLAAALGNKIKASQGSQRGNPLDKDWYQSLSLGLSYRLISKNTNSLHKVKKRSVHCPRFKY